MRLSNTYAELPAAFYQRIRPSTVQDPGLLLFNGDLARDLGFDDELTRDGEALARCLSGNELLPGSEPVALAYAGHQFGNFVPSLGDGRAHLLGELVDREGRRRDLQLKGSGRTSFSRGGDGRCALGPAIREFVMSEAMHALGVPTTRCLAVVTTGEQVFREEPLPGAVVARVAASHLRVGTFEYFVVRRDHASLRTLCDYAVARHDPDLAAAPDDERPVAFLERVMERQIELVVQWMRVGFIHGVMNTDNTAISGETIDYGPCAMMSGYDPRTVFSSIDHGGRYAFGNQPGIAAWNLSRLAACLVPLVGADKRVAVERLDAVLGTYEARFEAAWQGMMGRKIGLPEAGPDDGELISSLLVRMEQKGLDYTVTFARLERAAAADEAAQELEPDLGSWIDTWRWRLGDKTDEAQALMRRHNPLVIPRNHHVEAVIARCTETGDAAPAEALLEAFRSPYEALSTTARYQDPPADGDRHYQTFCGT